MGEKINYQVELEEGNFLEKNSKEFDLKDIFEKYSKKKRGYFPLQHPTGNGKTYFLEQFLINNLANDFQNLNKKKIIVMTNNKVNVNEIYRGIKKGLKKLELEEKIDNVFQVKSVKDILNDQKFLDEIIEELELNLDFYKNLKNFSKLKKKIKWLRYTEEQIDREDILKDELIELRNNVFKYFKDKLDPTKKKIELPKFISKLYPMIEDENHRKKIYIMTTDKFLYGYVGQTKTEYFYEKYKDSLIFIDEVDTAKEKFLNFIINRQTLTTMNIINFFNEIYNSFSKNDNNFFKILLNNIFKNRDKNLTKEEVKDLLDRKTALKDRFNKLKARGREIRKKYYTTSTYYELENEERIDLFEDKNYYFKSDEKKFYLDIKIGKSLITERETDIDISEMINEIFDFCYNKFYQLLFGIYEFHMKVKEDEDIEREIISNFFYNRETQEKILEIFKNYFLKNISLTKEERSFFRKRCGYIRILRENPEYKSNKKVMISAEYMYFTPEEFFYLICKRNFVVGISATAETETCIGNFDIKWLRRVLKEEYYQMTEWEKKKLKESLLRINSFEEKINRNLNIYEEKGLRQSKDENGFKNVLSLFKRKKFMKVKLINICEEYFLKVNNFENEEDENIYVKKYFEYTALVFLNFILDKDSRSLLFLSNRLMYKKQFQELVGDFVKELGNEVKNEVFFKSLSAKELDLELEKTPSEEGSLLNKLENHNIKTIIFTTYQSAGVGVNIKHKYDEDLNENLEKIDDELNKEIRLPLIYKDIDDIALEIKTNLINSDEEKDKNSDKKIRLVYLTDLLLENGIIDKNTRSSLLNRGNDMNLKKNYSKTYDYIENAIGKFIQGLGRCNRTKVRNKSRNIYIDKRTNKAIENFIPGDRLFIGDFNFLLKKLKKENNTEDYIKKIIASNKGIEIFYKNKYLEEIKILNKKINYIKNSSENNSEYLIKIKNELRGIYEEYMKLRKYILKNPTRNKENYINSQYYFSIDRPISSYKLIGENFDIKKIEFQDEKDKNNLSRGTKLNEIFKIPSLNKFCEENIGKFDKNKEIILPYVYQAIYKGMLGEVVIKEIFRIFDIKLKSEEYLIGNGIVEVFDDVSENGSYIDYKNYNLEGLKNRTLFNEIAEERINYKKSYLNSKRKLFIINLIGNNNEFLGNELGFYKYEDIIGKKEKTCKYIESEVVIVSGVLRYKEDRKSLEINKNLMSTLKDMLEGNYEG